MSDVFMRILMSANAGNTLSVIGGVTKALSGGSGLSGTILSMGAMAGVAAGALAIGLGVVSVKASADFQQAMLSNVAHAGLAKNMMDSVGQSVLQMATDVGRSPTQLAEAMYPVLSSFSNISNQSAKAALSLDVLKFSFQAVAGTTVNGTDVAQAAVGTFNALGLATNNATTNAARMKTLFDQMDLTVQLGNMQWSNYKSVISKLAVSIQGTGISFTEASAALATMTNEGFSAQKAQTYLSNTFTTMAIKTDAMAAHAKKLGISFDQQGYSSMNLAGKIEYLNKITGGNKQEILALLGNNATALKTFNALSTGIKGYEGNVKALTHSQGALKTSFDTASQGFSFQMDRIKAAGQTILISIGQQLLPSLTGLAKDTLPVIQRFAQWVSSSQVLTKALGVLFGWWHLLAGVATTLGQGIGIVVGFFQRLAGSVNQTTGPFAGFWSVMRQVQQFVISAFLPVWQQLVAMYNSQLKPAFSQLIAAIMPMMPVFKLIGGLILGVVVVALVILVGVLAGVARGVAGLLSGLITVFGGIVQAVTGTVQVISGIVMFLYHLFTGNFSALSGDLRGIWTGIVNIFSGSFKIIMGLGQAFIGAVVGFFSGFFQTIVGIFHSLADTLVGHSIVPDMLNAMLALFGAFPGQVVGFIMSLYSQAVAQFNALRSAAIVIITTLITQAVAQFQQLPGRAMSAISTLRDQMAGFFSGLASQAFSWGANVVTSIASGIQSAVGAVGQAASNVAGEIKNFLGFHSPTKKGPGSTAHLWMPALVKMMSDDLKNGSPKAMQAAAQLMKQVETAIKAKKLQIAHADLAHNSSLAKHLRAQRADMELQLKQYRDLLTIHHDTYSAKKGIITHTGSSGSSSSNKPNYGPGSIKFIAEPKSGHTVVHHHHTYNIQTMARNQSEVKRLVDMIEAEQGNRFRTQTAGYSSGGVF